MDKKKRILIIVLSIVGALVLAAATVFTVFMVKKNVQVTMSSETYESLLVKAKEYENKREWCYALGYYYDAITMKPENSDEVQERYSAIFNAIKDGNPGLGSFNEFQIHDNWILLLQNTEKYWTEFCPKYFIFGKLTKNGVDYKSHTAVYSISIESHYSAKFNEILNVIKKGFTKAYRKDWNDMPEYWPDTSIYSPTSKVMMNDAALINVPKNSFPAWNNELNNCGLYSLTFSLYDQRGNEILKSGRYLEGSGPYTFTKVSEKNMDIIEKDLIVPKLTALYLEYGMYNETKDGSNKAYLKNMKKKQVPANQNDKYIDYQNIKDIVSWVSCNNKAKQIKDYTPEEANGMVFVRGTVSIHPTYSDGFSKYESDYIDNFYMAKTEVTQAEYEKVMETNPSKYTGNSRPVECVSYYDAVVYCNTRSIQEGLTVCYTYNSSDSLVCNTKENGYRLPTLEEWVYAAKGGINGNDYKYSGSDDSKDVACYLDLSTSNVASKKPNSLKIYDMSGNVWEMVEKIHDGKCNVCGGAFNSMFYDCKITSMLSCNLNDNYTNVGFRVVRTCVSE